MARRGNGRQRVVMQRIPKESARQVTFSKRRSGLMKKASELCTLCAAEVLIVVFSPGGKVFSFGHPSTESMFRRFLGEEHEPGSETREIIQAHRSSKQSNLNFHHTQLESLLDTEKRNGDAIDQMRRETEGRVWWEQPIDGFNLKQMELFMERAVIFRESVEEEVYLLQQEQQGRSGSMFDPKGKWPANGFPSTQAPLDPMIFGLNGRVPYDPIVTGSSSRALFDSRIHRLNDVISFGPMASGSSSQPPLDPRTHRHNGGIQFDLMASGSSSQTSLEPRTPGFYGGLPYDPMMAGASRAMPFNQMAMGLSIGGVPYNPSPLGFQASGSVDPNAPRANNGGFGASSNAEASVYMMPHGSNQPYGHGFH